MKPSMNQKLDRIFQLVKQEKNVGLFRFCDTQNLSPSTFYQYAKLVTGRYENIILENGSLKWVDTP